MTFSSTAAVLMTAAAGCAARPGAAWRELAPLPDARGLAGAFVGTSHGALVVAGGANFDPPVWDTGKTWHDRIWVLGAPDGRWTDAGRMPRAAGYGAAASYRDARSGRELIVCVGGEDGSSVSRACFTMEYDGGSGRVVVRDFPALPTPLANASAVVVGETLFVVGGQTGAGVSTATAGGFRMDLRAPDGGWSRLPPIPGGPRVYTHLVAQRGAGGGTEPLLYVIGGRRAGDDVAGLEFLRDVWALDPGTGEWAARAAAPREVTAGQAVAAGARTVLLLGYADGQALREAERRGVPMRDFDHPGFSRQALAYDTVTDRWRALGRMPAGPVTTSAVPWAGGFVIPSGEVRPRVRSPKVWHVALNEVP